MSSAPFALVKDMTGQKLGRLTVVAFAGSKGGRARWRCRCDCGNEKIAEGVNLRIGGTRSCGCIPTGRPPVHGACMGDKRTPEYCSWRSMMARCFNQKNKSYKRYGGRGITVCDRWKRFSAFLADIMLIRLRHTNAKTHYI